MQKFDKKIGFLRKMLFFPPKTAGDTFWVFLPLVKGLNL
jgi:hypothetical protein